MNGSYLIYFAWFGVLATATFSVLAAVLWTLMTYDALQPSMLNRFFSWCALAVACFLPVVLTCKSFVKHEARVMSRAEGAFFAMIFGAIASLVGYLVVMIVGFFDDPNQAHYPISAQEFMGFGLATMLYGTIVLFVPNCIVLWGFWRLARSKFEVPIE